MGRWSVGVTVTTRSVPSPRRPRTRDSIHGPIEPVRNDSPRFDSRAPGPKICAECGDFGQSTRIGLGRRRGIRRMSGWLRRAGAAAHWCKPRPARHGWGGTLSRVAVPTWSEIVAEVRCAHRSAPPRWPLAVGWSAVSHGESLPQLFTSGAPAARPHRESPGGVHDAAYEPHAVRKVVLSKTPSETVAPPRSAVSRCHVTRAGVPAMFTLPMGYSRHGNSARTCKTVALSNHALDASRMNPCGTGKAVDDHSACPRSTRYIDRARLRSADHATVMRVGLSRHRDSLAKWNHEAGVR